MSVGNWDIHAQKISFMNEIVAIARIYSLVTLKGLVVPIALVSMAWEALALVHIVLVVLALVAMALVVLALVAMALVVLALVTLLLEFNNAVS